MSRTAWRGGRCRLAGTCLLVASALVPAGAVPVAADEPRPVAAAPNADPEVTRWVRRFLRRPPERRAWPMLFRDFPPDRADEAPVALRLLAADHYLRAGRPRVASRLFLHVFENAEDEQAASLASLGLAWAAVGSGDPALARELLVDRHDRRQDTSPLTAVLLALVEASNGRYDEAARILDEVLVRGAASPAHAAVTRLARAYVDYWRGDLRAAADAFDAVARTGVAPLIDDGRYAAAWARYTAGATDDALQQLRALADTRRGACAAGRDSVQLTPEAILRDGFRRYRRAPVAAPDVALVGLLDADGAARACAALRLVGGDGPAPVAVVPARHDPVPPRPVARADAVQARPDAPRPTPGSTTGRLIALLLLVATLAWYVGAKRRGARRPR